MVSVLQKLPKFKKKWIINIWLFRKPIFSSSIGLPGKNRNAVNIGALADRRKKFANIFKRLLWIRKSLSFRIAKVMCLERTLFREIFNFWLPWYFKFLNWKNKRWKKLGKRSGERPSHACDNEKLKLSELRSQFFVRENSTVKNFSCTNRSANHLQ